MSEPFLCDDAEIEYIDAFCWYAERSSTAAFDFENEFDQSLRKITSHPERFPKCDHRHRFYLMRKFPYQIIYRIHDAQLVVIAVAHTSREPNYWANR